MAKLLLLSTHAFCAFGTLLDKLLSDKQIMNDLSQSHLPRYANRHNIPTNPMGEDTLCTAVWSGEFYNLVAEYDYTQFFQTASDTQTAYFSYCRYLANTASTNCNGTYYAAFSDG